MDYFDDLNPYLVKEEEMPTRQETPTPPAQPAEQTYVENILRVNVGKLNGSCSFSIPTKVPTFVSGEISISIIIFGYRLLKSKANIPFL